MRLGRRNANPDTPCKKSILDDKSTTGSDVDSSSSVVIRRRMAMVAKYSVAANLEDMDNFGRTGRKDRGKKDFGRCCGSCDCVL